MLNKVHEGTIAYRFGIAYNYSISYFPISSIQISKICSTAIFTRYLHFFPIKSLQNLPHLALFSVYRVPALLKVYNICSKTGNPVNFPLVVVPMYRANRLFCHVLGTSGTASTLYTECLVLEP